MGTTASALVGFACVGFGFSAVFPIVCSVAGANAGNRPEQGIAAVSTTGYLGFLVGPPLIGFLARAYSLRLALGLVAMMSGLTAAMTGIVRSRRRQRLVTFEGEHRHQDHGQH
jgi:fucose permease